MKLVAIISASMLVDKNHFVACSESFQYRIDSCKSRTPNLVAQNIAKKNSNGEAFNAPMPHKIVRKKSCPYTSL